MKGKEPLFSVNLNYCKACGICYGLCPKQALAPDSEGRPVFAHPEQCTICKQCEYRCPDFAIRMEVKCDE